MVPRFLGNLSTSSLYRFTFLVTFLGLSRKNSGLKLKIRQRQSPAKSLPIHLLKLRINTRSYILTSSDRVYKYSANKLCPFMYWLQSQLYPFRYQIKNRFISPTSVAFLPHNDCLNQATASLSYRPSIQSFYYA